MPDADPHIALDAATLAAELDARWPDAVGEQCARADETHRLALMHPQYDGFITLHVTARCDVDGVFVLPDAELAPIITTHHRTGPIMRGQELPIDLELHPGKVRTPASSGVLRLVDSEGADVAPAVRVTLATDASLDCVLAGTVDGPWTDPEEFDAVVAELLDGEGSARRLAERIERVAAGSEDPGWDRRRRGLWRRRRP